MKLIVTSQANSLGTYITEVIEKILRAVLGVVSVRGKLAIGEAAVFVDIDNAHAWRNNHVAQ